MNYIVLEGIWLYAFLSMIILMLVINILSLIALLITENRNFKIKKSLCEESRKVAKLIKMNFKLRLKSGEYDVNK